MPCKQWKHMFNIIQTCAKSIKIHSIFHWTAEAQISIFHSRVQIFNLWKTRWGAQTIYQGLRNTSVSSVSRRGFEKAEWRRDSRPCSEVGCLRIEIATLPREGHNPARENFGLCVVATEFLACRSFLVWRPLNVEVTNLDLPSTARLSGSFGRNWMERLACTWFQPWEHIGNLRILIQYSRETT